MATEQAQAGTAGVRTTRAAASRPPRRRGGGNLSAEKVQGDAERFESYTYDRARWHELRAGRYEVLDTWARLLIAIAAALSALSLIQDEEVLATVLAITTAVVSAITSALNPGDLSARHRRAAREYYARARTFFLVNSAASQHLDKVEGAATLDELNRDLRAAHEAMDAVEEAAPPVNILRIASDGGPRNLVTYGLLRHRLWLERKADALNREQSAILLQRDAADHPSPYQLSALEERVRSQLHMPRWTTDQWAAVHRAVAAEIAANGAVGDSTADAIYARANAEFPLVDLESATHFVDALVRADVPLDTGVTPTHIAGWWAGVLEERCSSAGIDLNEEDKRAVRHWVSGGLPQ